MNSIHHFGGDWTENKLTRLKKYLDAYISIFKSNMRAARLHTIYVDAFAGTGYRNIEKTKANIATLPLLDDAEAVSFQKGSAYIALEMEPSFDEYIFIEQSSEYSKELEKLRIRFPEKSNKVTIIQQDANSYLQKWCRNNNWRFDRAVIFLDPYGMQVEWKTIAVIANTKAIDLWILFPLGQAVNRLLTKKCPPTGAWADRLTRFFGTEDWKNAFYQECQQLELFQKETSLKKEANFASIGKYFIEQLKSVFEGVAENPLPLRNTRNIPIFLLCFAASNPTGAKTAVKIAQHILGK
ncbi:three-Cys-motif partner protein TcmP [candidate division KSB1 bacterium]|nr:three-Cys-motif partner protein TcmP [candidate division KSB1 bacterium]